MSQSMFRELLDRWRYRKFYRALRKRGYTAKRVSDTTHGDFPGVR